MFRFISPLLYDILSCTDAIHVNTLIFMDLFVWNDIFLHNPLHVLDPPITACRVEFLATET